MGDGSHDVQVSGRLICVAMLCQASDLTLALGRSCLAVHLYFVQICASDFKQSSTRTLQTLPECVRPHKNCCCIHCDDLRTVCARTVLSVARSTDGRPACVCVVSHSAKACPSMTETNCLRCSKRSRSSRRGASFHRANLPMRCGCRGTLLPRSLSLSLSLFLPRARATNPWRNVNKGFLTVVACVCMFVLHPATCNMQVHRSQRSLRSLRRWRGEGDGVQRGGLLR
jgi:hypothetical protein|eukprot:COSAG06_NODE_12228_length_1407_cov_1.069572_2_plen_227_part_00